MTFARAWLVLGTLFLAAGVWFLVAARRPTTPAAPAPTATVRQLMLGLVIPASTAIFESAGTIDTPTGTVEKAPKTARDWDIVGAHAAMLVEASHLLRADGRQVQDPVWIDSAAAMEAGARNVMVAARAHNVDDLLDKGGEIVAACDQCHEKFLPGAR